MRNESQLPSSSAQSTLFSSSPAPKHLTSRGVLSWKPIAIFLLMIIVSAEAQTFQYSRGWTNGKRNGGPVYGGPSAIGVGPYDLENGYFGMEPLDAIIPPGHLQMNLGPQGRFRSIDYNQLLAKRMGGAGSINSRKQPLWFGTILGVEGAADAASSVGASASNSNPNSPASRSTGSADF